MYLWRGPQNIGKGSLQRLIFLFAMVLLLSACTSATPFKPEVLMTGLSNPCALVFDNFSHLYVAESGTGRILALQPHNKEKWVLQDGFKGLSGLAIDRDNILYVAARGHSGQNCVYALTPKGNRNLYCDNLDSNYGLTVDRHGRVLITESDSGRILRVRGNGGVEVFKQNLPDPKQVMDIHGMLVFVCACGLYTDITDNGRYGSFSHIPGTYAGISASAKDGTVYVLDSARNRLQCFDGNGALLAVYDCGKRGLTNITALACDRDGALYAATASGEIVYFETGLFRGLQAAASATTR